MIAGGEGKAPGKAALPGHSLITSAPLLLARASLPRSCATGSPELTVGAQPSSDDPQAERSFTIFLTSRLFRIMFHMVWCWGSHQGEKEWGAWPWRWPARVLAGGRDWR